MKEYTAKMSFEFAFKCPEDADPEEEAIELIKYFGEAVSPESYGESISDKFEAWCKQDTIKVEIFDLEKYQPSDYQKGEYELYCRYVEN
jgi:hypothetical protein